MSEQPQEVTAEEYKVRVLKNRFAEKVTEYEDIIASLITTQAQLEQEVARLRGDNSGMVQEEEAGRSPADTAD